MYLGNGCAGANRDVQIGVHFLREWVTDRGQHRYGSSKRRRETDRPSRYDTQDTSILGGDRRSDGREALFIAVNSLYKYEDASGDQIPAAL